MPPVTSPRPIAIVAPMYAPAIGGVERHVERLAEGLVARGIPVEVIVTDPTGLLPAMEVRNGVTVRRFPSLRGDHVYYISPRMQRWLWHNAGRFALLHAHNYHGVVPLMSGLAARHTSVPLVVTPHYHGTGHTRFRALLHVPYRPFGSWAMRHADRIVAVSAAEAALIERDFGVTPSVIPNGVDLLVPNANGTGDGQGTGDHEGTDDGKGTSRGRGTGARKPLTEVSLLSVGRLEGYKQVSRIVGALPELPRSHVLTIVGEGPDRAAIADAAATLGVADRLRLLGRVSSDELAQCYAQADAFVTLSLEEAFGMTVLEAGAAGAPVLASDIPAHREVAAFAAPGRIRLVDAAAEPAAVAAAIQEVVALGRTTDLTGWSLPTWAGMVDALVSVYESVLGAPLGA